MKCNLLELNTPIRRRPVAARAAAVKCRQWNAYKKRKPRTAVGLEICSFIRFLDGRIWHKDLEGAEWFRAASALRSKTRRGRMSQMRRPPVIPTRLRWKGEKELL